MRRRAIIAERTKVENIKIPPVSKNVVFTHISTEEGGLQALPGVCGKCGKKIGRGVNMHQKYCKG